MSTTRRSFLGRLSAAAAAVVASPAIASRIPQAAEPSAAKLRPEPQRWNGALLCDGSIHSVEAYPELFQVIGHDWQENVVPDGYFQLPDLPKTPPLRAGGMGNHTHSIGTIQAGATHTHEIRAYAGNEVAPRNRRFKYYITADPSSLIGPVGSITMILEA